MLRFLALAVLSSVVFGLVVYVISPFAARLAASALDHDPPREPSREQRRLEEALAEDLPLELSPASLSGVYVGPYDEEFQGFTTIELEPTRYHLRFPRNPECGTQVGEDGTWNLRDRKVEFHASWSFLAARPLEVGVLDGDLLLVRRDDSSSIAEVYRRELGGARSEKK